MNELKLYTLSQKYFNYIKQFDKRVPSVAAGKDKRPFIGVVLEINGCNYFAPLTSPKIKHLHMHNAEDFLKIENGRLGAINLNNMIPVPMQEVRKVEMNRELTDSEDTKKYKTLLENQRRWCNNHKKQIINKATNLRNVIDKPEKRHLRERCCDFPLLEKKCLEYENRVTKTIEKTKQIDLE